MYSAEFEGRSLVETGCVRQVGSNVFIVKSKESSTAYGVLRTRKNLACPCRYSAD